MNKKVVTIFGGTGFVGRQLVHRLASHGTEVRVAARDFNAVSHLKMAGDVGQIVPIQRHMTAVTSGRHQDLCSAGKLRNLNYCNHKVGSREFLILILENQKVKTRTLRCKMTTAAANQAKSTGMIMLQKIN